MKKLVLTAVTTLMAICISAAPALRGLFTVEQPDGTLLSIEQFGDEYHHWTATSDGTLVVNTGHGYYVAQIDETGELTASALLAHEPAQRKESEQVTIRLQTARRALFHQRGQQARRRAMNIGSDLPYLPHHGEPRVLCILAQYQDVQFTVNEPLKAFEQLMNGDVQKDLGNRNDLNIASASQFFQACSHGTFSPHFDIVGPVTLPYNMAYYGGTDSSGSDDKFRQFCTDAVNCINSEHLVADWGRYDNDGDNRVELVCIIFAGYGQNQGGADNTIWAKAGYQDIKVDDNYRVSFFNCSSELFSPEKGKRTDGTEYDYSQFINGTGVFLHEFSHCMGLPDLYTPYHQQNNQNMESWDLMDYGCYNNNGYAPCLYTAWEQETMGWISMEAITDASQITSQKPLEEGGMAYKIVNPDNERDYIALENIQQRGFSSGARGHGLLAYHVAYPKDLVNMGDRANDTSGHPAVAVVPASGTLINSYLRGTGKTYTTLQWQQSMEAATFPGTGNVTSLSDDMALPNYCFYEGTSGRKPVGYTLSNIAEDDLGNISFTIGETTDVTPLQVRQEDTSAAYFDLQGRRIKNPTHGLYIRNGRKVVVR